MRAKRRLSAHADRPYIFNRSTKRASPRTKSALLLKTISGYYAAALERLLVDEMPALIPRPRLQHHRQHNSRRVPDRREPPAVTSMPDDDGNEKKKKKKTARARRRRRKALSRAVNGTRKVSYWLPARSSSAPWCPGGLVPTRKLPSDSARRLGRIVMAT